MTEAPLFIFMIAYAFGFILTLSYSLIMKQKDTRWALFYTWICFVVYLLVIVMYLLVVLWR